MLILRNCRLIKELTEDYSKQYADILIDGKYIIAINDVGTDFKVQCEEINICNKTVIPGLFDLHAHIDCRSLDPSRMHLKGAGTTAFEAYECGREYLRQGYTTVRDCGCRFNAAIALRDAINEGIVQGPRMIASGLIITPTERGNSTFETLYVEADGPEEVRKACRQELQKGADFIKVMGTGAFYNVGGVPGETISSLEEFEAAVKVAEMKNTYVAAHCHGTGAIKLAINAGIRTIEHGSFIDDVGISMLKGNDNCFIIPTLSIFMVTNDDPSLIPNQILDTIKSLKEAMTNCIINAYKAGLKLGWGTDIDFENLKKRPGYEFIVRKKILDFDNIDMLLQATKYSAEIVRLNDRLGTVKAGKYADLIVIDGNPDDNIFVMEKDLIHVLKEGNLIY
ncbi:MAG: amidohydrolase family protein [Desulfosporosinus sp.]|nr:amidohydrolase family protein [Desulfosporosinus sp.]